MGRPGKLRYYLKPFDIIPQVIKEPDGSTSRGYKLALFQDAFSRYLPGLSPVQRNHVTTPLFMRLRKLFHNVTKPFGYIIEIARSAFIDAGGYVVTSLRRGDRGEETKTTHCETTEI